MEYLTFSKILKSSIEELNNLRPEDIVSFGYDWLDDKLTALFPGEIVVIGAESGSGKTTFATNIIYKASKNHKCAVFALEDRLPEYGMRALYFEIGKIRKQIGKDAKNYKWNDYRKNQIKDPRYQEFLNQAEENLKNENILFADVKKQMNIDDLEKLIEEKTKEGYSLFLIDHLHYFDLMRGSSTKADYIEQIMVRLHTLLIKTGARLILIVHYKKLGGMKPGIDSFKDSASIFQNANYVINIWRDRTLNATQYITTFSVPKSRNPNGEGTIEVEFDPATNDYKPVKNWWFGTERSDGGTDEVFVEQLEL